MNPTAVRAAVHKVISEMVGAPVSNSEPLISSGLIDSLAILKIISNLENKLGVALPTQNLQPDDFETVDWIVDIVLRVAQPR
jgi:acyl carrier protein